MGDIRYDGKVAIVTGAGNGLGREYALMLAKRGAKVVVNDLGGSVKGEGQNAAKHAADVVVDEIRAAGGTAVANKDSVEFGDRIVKTAVDNFGTVDIVINNAGILRDISFQKMTELDWDLIMKVHLKGAFSVTRAAWNIMREKNYGRIVNTGSSAGIFGSFGQVNYSTAKLGLFGFTQSLAKEGAKRNIRCNCIAPLAGTRMTETVMPKEVVAALSPSYVAPFVGWLVSEQCQENGSLYEVGAGFIAKQRWNQSQGVQFDVDGVSPEAIRDKWAQVNQYETGSSYPTSNQDMMATVMTNLEAKAQQRSAAASAGGAAAATGGSGLKSEKIFGMMSAYLAGGHGKALISKVDSIFGFQITTKKGAKPSLIYEIDLKNGQGMCK